MTAMATRNLRGVNVAGIGMTRFAKQADRDTKDLTAEAVQAALKDADVDVLDVQSAFVANAVGGSITGQEMLLGQFVLRPLGIGEIPVTNVENACASASTAFHLAWQAVATGLVDVALAVGVEKMTHPDKSRSFAAIGGAVDVDLLPAKPPRDRSFLMDSYAEAALRYMRTSGATVEDFARVVVKNQHNGTSNPFAQYGAELTVADVLAQREIVAPFTLPMCSPITDGAAATVLVADGTRFQDGDVGVLACELRSASVYGAVPVSTLAAEAAYERCGVGPDELDVVELHDATASAELTLYEQLGLGDGPELIRNGATALGGRIPVNTSGGLLSRGHPIGATGLAQIVEVVTQLRGAAGARQVDGARRAMTQNAGGWHLGDNVASVVTIFGA